MMHQLITSFFHFFWQTRSLKNTLFNFYLTAFHGRCVCASSSVLESRCWLSIDDWCSLDLFLLLGGLVLLLDKLLDNFLLLFFRKGCLLNSYRHNHYLFSIVIIHHESFFSIVFFSSSIHIFVCYPNDHRPKKAEKHVAIIHV
jgi:hypothetical protein